ncbi:MULTISPECIES: lysis protein [Proteus]|uniref:Lysis protein n=1 Tax=Proteus mirabilis TaxID=584 RepID=A0ABD5M0C9_PROMI|nr:MULTISPECIES: lysis protein [Proteus]AWS54570.1 lysis protein [Proteus mirabilis]EHT2447315.1 lysis protein [Proteus mirabilis]EKU0760757.1 lysis protein [Proteus mirabilis]EKX9206361.1 lysis protein [Proteus mirabilis]ELB1228192.1 lysis protein [Proteus mirabilis]
MNITKLLTGSCVVLAFWLWWVRDDYDKLSKDYNTATSQLSQQIEINNKYQSRITKLNELDTKHTKELSDAMSEISQLRVSAERNPNRVYIKAECPKSEGATTSGVANATTARPTDTAIRNYWLLRERIAQSEQMIKRMQEYIKAECNN